MVCICVPTFNAATTLRESLESILNQNYQNIVVLVLDNASTDGTLDVAMSFTDPRLSVHSQAENIGAEGNFTRCISHATGKYTAIFHADDLYDRSMIASQVEYLERNPGVSAVFTEALTIDGNNAVIGHIGGIPGTKSTNGQIGFRGLLQAMLLHHNFLVCPSAMVRSEVYLKKIVTWGDKNFRSASDVDTWLRLANDHLIAVIDRPLMRYRISQTQYSHLNRNRTDRADFFLVMDEYISRAEVRRLLTADDLRHYSWLERHDRAARAMNLFALGRIAEARNLMKGLLCWDAVYAALKTRRGLVTLAGAALLSLLIPFGALPGSKRIIKAAKQLSWR